MQELLEQIKSDLKTRLSEHRYAHTESVVKTALEIGHKYNLDQSTLTKIEIAAWLHDCCKELKNEELAILASFYKVPIYDLDRKYPNLLHARVGAHWVEDEYEIHDPYILKAIEEHTLAGKDMLISSKILFLADMLEPRRDQNKPSDTLNRLRKMISDREDIDRVLLEALNSKIDYMLKKNQALHPLSIEHRNVLLETQS
jgi:predicted HD superfamily hydrolase involved in NAD metabolism